MTTAQADFPPALPTRGLNQCLLAIRCSIILSDIQLGVSQIIDRGATTLAKNEPMIFHSKGVFLVAFCLDVGQIT